MCVLGGGAKKLKKKQIPLFWEGFFLKPRGNLRGVKPLG